MKEVFISGEIGYDWWSDSGNTAKTVAAQLEGIADGEDIQISIDSPGGSVYEGIVIFNLIRDYAKSHSVSVRIIGIAMSMASYIALAARTVDKNASVTVSDNSIFMIHNPWGVSLGDYRQLKKDADYFEKLASVLGSVYAAVSKKTEKEIRVTMDEETFYVGKEIYDADFANEFNKINENETEPDGLSSRSALIVNAKLAFDKTIEKAREAKSKNALAYNDELKKAVALYEARPPLPQSENLNVGAGKKINVGGTMKPEELLVQDKDCYEAVFALGEKSALEKERKRVEAHLRRGEKVGAMDIAMKHIKGGTFVTDEAVNDEYIDAALNKKQIDARSEDNPPPIHTDENEGAEDDEKLAAAFDNGLKGRNAGGKSWME